MKRGSQADGFQVVISVRALPGGRGLDPAFVACVAEYVQLAVDARLADGAEFDRFASGWPDAHEETLQ